MTKFRTYVEELQDRQILDADNPFDAAVFSVHYLRIEGNKKLEWELFLKNYLKVFVTNKATSETRVFKVTNLDRGEFFSVTPENWRGWGLDD